MKTGKLIEAIMQYKHIGIEEFADKLGIAGSNLSILIVGKRNITTSLAIKIGEVLDIEPMVLMTNRTLEEIKNKNKEK
jgi:plasmid maintenance system antidote protein VapI